MTIQRLRFFRRPAVCAAIALPALAAFAAAPASAQTTASSKPTTKAAKPTAKAATATNAKGKGRGKAAAQPVEYVPPPADREQIDAATKVYYGNYDCEFKQSIHIIESTKYPAFIDVTHGKALYRMKPVLSSTGAIRLEDIRGETLMVQISSKSMLLNVKSGQRIVDECVSPKQRELIEAARLEKEQREAAAKDPEAAKTAAAAPPALLSGGAPVVPSAPAAPSTTLGASPAAPAAASAVSTAPADAASAAMTAAPAPLPTK